MSFVASSLRLLSLLSIVSLSSYMASGPCVRCPAVASDSLRLKQYRNEKVGNEGPLHNQFRKLSSLSHAALKKAHKRQARHPRISLALETHRTTFVTCLRSIRMPDKLWAVEQLAKLCGWNESEKHEHGASNELTVLLKRLRGGG
jgi:hypothetical protein